MCVLSACVRKRVSEYMCRVRTKTSRERKRERDRQTDRQTGDAAIWDFDRVFPLTSSLSIRLPWQLC